MQRHLIILNPAAGGGLAGRLAPRLRQTLQALRLNFDLVPTEGPGHAIQLASAAAADGYAVIAAAGGDGTVNEVLNGVLQGRSTDGRPSPALGVLAIGRGNDFAFGVGAPSGLDEGCQALAGGRRRPIDVGRVTGGLYPDGRYFGNGVGIGFDAVVGFEAAKLKPLGGFAGYAVAALKTVSLYDQAPLVDIDLDGTSVRQPALMVSVMNGRRMGGGFLMGPSAAPDDGWLDVCVAGQVSRRGILGLIPRFMQGRQAGHPAIRQTRARRVTVTAVHGALPAHADGETLCTDGRTLTLELQAGRLDVITGAA